MYDRRAILEFGSAPDENKDILSDRYHIDMDPYVVCALYLRQAFYNFLYCYIIMDIKFNFI